MESLYLLGGMVLVFVVILVLLGLYSQYKVRKEVEGKMWCTFITDTGDRIDQLATKKGELLVVEKPPCEGHYAINWTRSWTCWYPPNRPRWLQVVVRSAIYRAYDVEPKEPPNPPSEALDPNAVPKVLDARVLKDIQDANFARVMVEQSKRTAEEEEGEYVPSKPPVLIYVGLALAVLFAGVAAFMVFTLGSDVSELQGTIDSIGTTLGVE